MSWIELNFHITGEAIDWVYTLLAKVGYNSQIRISPYQQESNQKQNSTQPWEFTIDLYLPDETRFHSQIRAIDNTFDSLRRTGLASEIEINEIDESPANSENQTLAVHYVGEKFAIAPINLNTNNPNINNLDTKNLDTKNRPSSSPSYPNINPSNINSSNINPSNINPSKIIIQTKPTLAFGSGFHPATMLALQLIERHIGTGMQGLDLGSGSGILSVAIAKLNAQVLALDNDPAATQATREIVQLNQVENLVTVKQGSLGTGGNLGHWLGGDISIEPDTEELTVIQPSSSFDFIVANILGRVHIQLAPEYYQSLNYHQGILITAGFNIDIETEVTDTFSQQGFQKIDCLKNEEWVALVHQKRA